MDKAGAYAIQGGASEFVESFDGDWNNIVGLPVDMLRSELESRKLIRLLRKAVLVALKKENDDICFLLPRISVSTLAPQIPSYS